MAYIYRLLGFVVLFALFLGTVMQENDLLWIGLAILFFLITHYLARWIGLGGLSGLGFKRHKQWSLSLLYGFLLGAVVQIVSLVIMIAIGAIEVKGINMNEVSTLVVSSIVLLISTAFIGFGEEALFRGYLIESLPKSMSKISLAMISAVLFAAAHLINGAFSILRFMELLLFGLTFAVIYLATKSIWFIAGLHFGIDFFYYFLGIGGESAYLITTSLYDEKKFEVSVMNVIMVFLLFVSSLIIARSHQRGKEASHQLSAK